MASSWGVLGRISEAQSFPREAQEAPKTSKKREKMEVTKQVVFRLDFFINFVCFFKFFPMIFKSKNAVKQPKTILAKTSKIVLPSRRNADFQEIEVTKNKNYKAQIDEKSYIFWDINFKSFWDGFWDGFGKPKPLIFAVFSKQNR